MKKPPMWLAILAVLALIAFCFWADYKIDEIRHPGIPWWARVFRNR